jgi:hypothetical protein
MAILCVRIPPKPTPITTFLTPGLCDLETSIGSSLSLLVLKYLNFDEGKDSHPCEGLCCPERILNSLDQSYCTICWRYLKQEGFPLCFKCGSLADNCKCTICILCGNWSKSPLVSCACMKYK